VPGTTHPIQCFVVDSQKFTKADLYKPGLRSAWDIDTARWLVFPERERVHDVQKEFAPAYAYAQIVRDKLVMLLKYDPPMVKVAWDNLHRQRHNDMLAGLGDFSGSNIAYKMVANSGLFPLISEATGEYIAKTAAFDPNYLYHLAPTAERQRIQDHGLIPSKPAISPHWTERRLNNGIKIKENPSPGIRKQTEGVYAFNTPEDIRYHTMGWYDQPMDMWRIPRESVQQYEKDPLVDNGYRILHPVQAELHEPYEDTEQAKEDLARARVQTGDMPMMNDWRADWGYRGLEGQPSEALRQYGIGFPNHVIGSEAPQIDSKTNPAEGWG